MDGETDLVDPTVARFWSAREWKCTVRDENGLILFVLHFYAVEAPMLAGFKS